jgi:tripartite-type tricarboxylate transporter receptor subunit TctC
LARLLADHFGRNFGAAFIVENRAGGGGEIGIKAVQTATPNGKIFLFTQSSFTQNAAFRKDAHKRLGDFDPIAMVGTTVMVLCVNTKSRVMTLADLMDLLRRQGDKISFSSAGVGSGSQLPIELFLWMTKLKMTHVPYRGTVAAVQALLAGEVDVGVGVDNSMIQHVNDGRLRCLASTAASRSHLFPDLPTIAEAADLRGYGVESWYGLLGPAGLSRPVIEKTNREVNHFLSDPNVSKYLDGSGIIPSPLTPEAFKEQLKAEFATYLELGEMTGLSKEP